MIKVYPTEYAYNFVISYSGFTWSTHNDTQQNTDWYDWPHESEVTLKDMGKIDSNHNKIQTSVCNSWDAQGGPGGFKYRADSRFVPSQWETSLLCNDVSHWLGASLGSALK